MSDGKIRGKIHFIDETKAYGQKGFRKRLVVLEQDKGRFTNYVPFEFVQDACVAADQLSVGDEVDIEYRLSGRKWQRDPNSEVKYFLSAEAVGFTRVGGDVRSSGTVSPDDVNSQFDAIDADDDEVPF